MKKKIKEQMEKADVEREERIRENLEKEARFWKKVPAATPRQGMRIYKAGMDGKFRDGEGNLMDGDIKEEGLTGTPKKRMFA